MRRYRGHCHCDAVRFELQSEELRSGCRCNCSMCVRKGTIMSEEYFPPERFELLSGADALGVYRWGDRMVNHWFCKTCGIAPFHDTTLKPGHYRVNVGCLDDVEPLALAIRILDGRAL